jgi:hypothetical protein
MPINTVPTDAEKGQDTMEETTSDPMPTEPTPPTQPAAQPSSILMGPGAAAAVPTTAPARHRPIVVTILAIGAGILAVLAGIHLLQALGIFPYVIGRFEVRAFSLFYAIMWGLLVWVYLWLIKALWNVERDAWIFLVVVTMFSLIFDFVMLVGSSTWSDVAASFLVSGLLLLYCTLPSTRRTFDTA